MKKSKSNWRSSNWRKGDERREEILNSAIEVAVELGYKNIQREIIARRINITPSLISHYFINMETLKREVMAAAIERNIYIIVSQGLGNQDPQAVLAPDKVKNKALNHLLGINGSKMRLD